MRGINQRELLTSAADGEGVVHAFYPTATRTLCNRPTPLKVKGWAVKPTCEVCVTTARAWHRIDGACPAHWHGLQVLEEAGAERLGPDSAASSSTRALGEVAAVADSSVSGSVHVDRGEPERAATSPNVSRPFVWTRESVVAAIQQWTADHDGVPPKSTEWQLVGDGRPSTPAVIRCFVKWSAAIEAAGLDSGYHLRKARESSAASVVPLPKPPGGASSDRVAHAVLAAGRAFVETLERELLEALEDEAA